VSIGLYAAYAHYDFPKTNDHLTVLVDELRKEYAGSDLGELGSDLGYGGYLQVLIWEGLGFRLGVQRVKAEPPETFGPIRGEIEAKTSPVGLSYSLIREFQFSPVRLIVGGGVDQYRWSVDWTFYEVGGTALEDWQWEGRGSGGHVLVEVAASPYDIPLFVGAIYHRGVIEMDLEDREPSPRLSMYPRYYEEDVNSFQLYGGVTFTVF
jgi:hypothetical protein